ncbi:MAG: DUF1015 domain-containing protein, partial [Spirochaetaceae bacterium]|nr:DUF1015 domain-containing protein [Spirochaetaceae bacterium]
MDDITEKLADAALAVPEILLPSKTIELAKWPVVACDQFTQERSFWDECAAGVGDAPSALHLVLPEVYLEDADCAARIAAIRRNMARYLQHGDGDVFDWPRNAGVFVERETRHGVRRGLVIAVDLEKYDWRGGSTSMIRASEDTIQERLPPRMEIRRGAPLEIPHVILLINDEENMLFSLLEKLMRGAPYTYNIDLCAGAGNVKGRLVCRKTDWNFIAGYFTHAYRQACTAYGKERAFLFAV